MRACGHGYRWLSCRVLHSDVSALLDLCRTFVVNSQYLFVHESRSVGQTLTGSRFVAAVPPEGVFSSLDAGKSEKAVDLEYRAWSVPWLSRRSSESELSFHPPFTKAHDGPVHFTPVVAANPLEAT